MIRDRKDDAGSDEGEVGAVRQSPSDNPGGSDVESILSSRVESILKAAEEAAAGIRAEAEERASHYLEDARRRADDVAAERIRLVSELTDTLVDRVRTVAQQSDELMAALDDAGRRVASSAAPSEPREEPPTQRFEPAPAQSPAPGLPPYVVLPSLYYPAAPPPAPQPPMPAAPAPPAPAPPAPAPPAPAPPAFQTASPPPAYAPPAQPPAAQAPPEPVAPPPSPQAYDPPTPQPPPAPAPPAPEPGPPVSDDARLLATQMAVAGSSRDQIAWRLQEEFGINDSTAILDELGI